MQESVVFCHDLMLGRSNNAVISIANIVVIDHIAGS